MRRGKRLYSAIVRYTEQKAQNRPFFFLSYIFLSFLDYRSYIGLFLRYRLILIYRYIYVFMVIGNLYRDCIGRIGSGSGDIWQDLSGDLRQQHAGGKWRCCRPSRVTRAMNKTGHKTGGLSRGPSAARRGDPGQEDGRRGAGDGRQGEPGRTGPGRGREEDRPPEGD